MCGRFSLGADATTLTAQFDLSAVPAWTPRYNIAPTQEILVVVQDLATAKRQARRRERFLKTHSPHALGLVLVGLLCALLLVGCGSKVSEANFERIHAGMTPAEVRAILGEPTESASKGVGPLVGTTATWKGKGGTITIQFVNDKVFTKQFVKPSP